MAKCDCFKTTLEKARKTLVSRLPDDITGFEADWEGVSYILDGKDHVPVNPKIAYEYRGVKKDKTPNKNLTKDTVSIIARYCPFCGIDTQAEE